MSKFKILRKTEKMINTSRGQSKKYSLQLQDSEGTLWASAWHNNISSQWREGDTIDIVLKPREWEGKTYYDVDFPKKDSSQKNWPELHELLEGLKRIEAKIDKLLPKDETGVPDMEEPPDEIPF